MSGSSIAMSVVLSAAVAMNKQCTADTPLFTGPISYETPDITEYHHPKYHPDLVLGEVIGQSKIFKCQHCPYRVTEEALRALSVEKM